MYRERWYLCFGGNLVGGRKTANKYQFIFKGEPLDLEEVRVKLLRLGYCVSIPEKATGQYHLEAYDGNWFIQIYGTGTINVFTQNKEDVFKVSEFLMSLGMVGFEFHKIIPRTTLLWEVFEKSDEGKSCKCYPKVFKIIRFFEVLLVKCFIDAFKSVHGENNHVLR
jgi:hypothetical protein